MTEEQAQQPTVLDSDQQQVGALYARALLGSAGDSADSLLAEFESVVSECLDKFPALEVALGSPRIDQEEKESLLERIFAGRIDPKLLNFFKVLCRRGRIGSLRVVQQTATVLREEELGKQRVQVTSSQPLTDAQKSDISAALKKSFGIEPVLIEKIDDSLLGGVVIRVGDQVVDGSVLGRMESVKQSLATGVQKALREKFESLISS